MSEDPSQTGVQSMHLHTRDFNWPIKKGNREQITSLPAHQRSHLRVSYSADWFTEKLGTMVVWFQVPVVTGFGGGGIVLCTSGFSLPYWNYLWLLEENVKHFQKTCLDSQRSSTSCLKVLNTQSSFQKNSRGRDKVHTNLVMQVYSIHFNFMRSYLDSFPRREQFSCNQWSALHQ